MAKKPVFYSFHFNNDVFRVQQVRNIGVIEGNEPTSPNDWESIKRKGDNAIKSWIDENMKYKQCVVVLVGSETSERSWVRYEIEKAWNDKKPVFGIYIHNIRCARTGTCRQGSNPFDKLTFKASGEKLSSKVKCYNPSANDAYNEIANNIGAWIDAAIRQRQQ